jgi:hypothetical protein
MPRHILQLPPDATGVEKKIIEYSYAHIYRSLTDPLDKFIVAFMFDLGNNASVTAVAAGCHRKTIWQKKKKIQSLLKNLKIDQSQFAE